MYVGGSLVLLALGAILAFAVQDSLAGIDLVTTGYILMAVAVIGLLFSVVTMSRSNSQQPPR